MSAELEKAVESQRLRMTPEYVERQVRELLAQGEDVGGGVNALRLMKHLLGAMGERDENARWAYERLKPALSAALEEITSLHYFEGD